MTWNKSSFIDLNEGINSQVKFGDGKMHKVEGKGVIALHTMGGKTKYISDVLLCSGPGQLMKKGYRVDFVKDERIIIEEKSNQIVAKIKMTQDKVFPLKM